MLSPERTLILELRNICHEQMEKWRNAYTRAYQHGGADYEIKMKQAERRMIKWGKRQIRVVSDKKLQDAIIRWL